MSESHYKKTVKGEININERYQLISKSQVGRV